MRIPRRILRQSAVTCPFTHSRRAGGPLTTNQLHRGLATSAHLYYQGPSVPRTLTSTGCVGVHRNLAGSDSDFFGVDSVPTLCEIQDGRQSPEPFSLDTHGFELVDETRENPHINYFAPAEVLDQYYPECEKLISRRTGASRVIAFDHNIRAKSRKPAAEAANSRGAPDGGGGPSIQEPLITYGVHNDYTMASAPRRVEQLAAPASANDTWRGTPRLRTDQVERLLKGRWLFVNVWRNVSAQPVQRAPLGLLDARTCSPEDLVVFEIRYADRVGENYFATHRPAHSWWYFPKLTRDECLLIKCWDSRGKDFAGRIEEARGWQAPASSSHLVPATFSLHTGFNDLATPLNAPERESIEVRTVAFFE